MRASPIFFLNIPFEERLLNIVSGYGTLDQEKLIQAIGRISEKLGGLNTKMATSLLVQGETLESFRILLGYYDRLYLKSLHNRKEINSLLHTIECKSITPENASQLLLYTTKQPEKA
jgi:tRNA 2-selenouridine synthase